MQTFTKILFATFMIALAASYGVYITTDWVTFVVMVYPASIAFALLLNLVGDWLYVVKQRKLAASLDGRLVEQFERKKQREARNKLVAKK
jgi:hypothetical protein